MSARRLLNPGLKLVAADLGPVLLLGVRLWRSFLVLLGTPPRSSHPVFCNGCSAYTRELRHSSRYRWRTVKVGGRRCAAWLKAKNDQENIRLVETRNYVPPQTAFYAHWLLFEKEAAFVGP